MAPASATNSPSSSTTSTTTTTTTITTTATSNPNPNPNPNSTNPWWESISKARSSILSLSSLLSLPSLSSLADSDRPASSLLSSSSSYSALSSSLSSSPCSGSSSDPLCQWLYETFHSSDPDLRLVVLSFIPLISALYFSRLSESSSLAGFESVLLTIYAAEARSRNGKPLYISVPDLSIPSLYHSPQQRRSSSRNKQSLNPAVGILSPPLEPQIAVKSTKRACIVGVVLDCYFKKISLMPVRSKIDFCEFVVSWAGQDCTCRYELDGEEEGDSLNSSSVSNFGEEHGRESNGNCNGGSSLKGSRVPLPWELMQPILKILGHCLFGPGNGQEVRDAASLAIRSVYARAVHELMPQVILASRSLIRLDNSARKAARDPAGMGMVGGIVSNPSTPSKPKKQEMLLVSK